MANELTINVSVRASKGHIDLTRGAKIRADLVGSKYSAGIQSIGDSAEAINISPDIINPGWAVFRNLSETETIQIGTVVDEASDATGAYFHPVMQLGPGIPTAMCLVPGVTYYAVTIGSAATADLEFTVFDE